MILMNMTFHSYHGIHDFSETSPRHDALVRRAVHLRDEGCEEAGCCAADLAGEVCMSSSNCLMLHFSYNSEIQIRCVIDGNECSRCTELSRTEVDLISAQSTLLVTHAQIERLRLQQGKKRRRRCSSWHGVDGTDRRVRREQMNGKTIKYHDNVVRVGQIFSQIFIMANKNSFSERH